MSYEWYTNRIVPKGYTFEKNNGSIDRDVGYDLFTKPIPGGYDVLVFYPSDGQGLKTSFVGNKRAGLINFIKRYENGENFSGQTFKVAQE